MMPQAQVVMATPDMARALLKRNASNRKLNDTNWQVIKRHIEEGLWYFNGDTVKVSPEGDLLDGQHRLRAIIEANKACLLTIVTGVPREAFAYIDTMRKLRSYGDVVHLKGSGKYQVDVGRALAWLCRYDRGIVLQMQVPENKIFNSDIELKFANCPRIQEAVERCAPAKPVVSTAMLACVYYALLRANNEELADRMVNTLCDPTNVRSDDPFYHLRNWLINNKKKRGNVVNTMAVMIKACNSAYRGETIKALMWKDVGPRAEAFPTLEAVEGRR